MFFPSLSMLKMVKDDPNHVPMNMIGLAQTSREIIEDGDVQIFLVLLSTPDPLQLSLHYHCGRTSFPVSVLCVEVNTICILP